MLIFIPLGLLLGFIATCVLLKYCKRPVVSDISLRISDDPHNDSIVDYSKLLLSPKQAEIISKGPLSLNGN